MAISSTVTTAFTITTAFVVTFAAMYIICRCPAKEKKNAYMGGTKGKKDIEK